MYSSQKQSFSSSLCKSSIHQELSLSYLAVLKFPCQSESLVIFVKAPHSNATQRNPTQVIYYLPLLSVSLCKMNYSLSNKLSLSPLTQSQLILWLTHTDQDICSIIMDSDRGGGQQANWTKPVGCPIYRGCESGVGVMSQLAVLYRHNQFTIITQKNMAWDLLHVKSTKLYSDKQYLNVWWLVKWKDVFKNEMEWLVFNFREK